MGARARQVGFLKQLSQFEVAQQLAIGTTQGKVRKNKAACALCAWWLVVLLLCLRAGVYCVAVLTSAVPAC